MYIVYICRDVPCQELSQGLCIHVHCVICEATMSTALLIRRTLDYQDVLGALNKKGIAIRVASPKLVMEEVSKLRLFS
jgi:hypothetical protein